VVAAGVAGLYVSNDATAEYRAGDVFFGVDPAGIAVQEHDGKSWQHIPRQAPPPSMPARLAITRTGNLYQFYYNGVWIAELKASGRGDTYVMLFAGPAVTVDFSAFSVKAMGAPPFPAPVVGGN